MTNRFFALFLVVAGFAPFTANAVLLVDTEYVAEHLSEGETITVTHDLSDLIPDLYTPDSAWVVLAFADDNYCFNGCDDAEEVAEIKIDLDVVGNHEVDGSIWSFWHYDWEIYGVTGSAFGQLSTTGMLDVTVTSTTGDFWWKKSLLSVVASPVSVPEPGTLILLGSGLLAMGFAGRRRRHHRP